MPHYHKPQRFRLEALRLRHDEHTSTHDYFSVTVGFRDYTKTLVYVFGKFGHDPHERYQSGTLYRASDTTFGDIVGLPHNEHHQMREINDPNEVQ